MSSTEAPRVLNILVANRETIELVRLRTSTLLVISHDKGRAFLGMELKTLRSVEQRL